VPSLFGDRASGRRWIGREHCRVSGPGTYSPFRPDLKPFIFDLFLGKPALFHSHAYEGEELFASGIDAFDPAADQVNALPGGVGWRSPGYILLLVNMQVPADFSVEVLIRYGD